MPLHHGDYPEPQGAAAPEPKDAASRSLSDALRVSFRLLSVLMIFVLFGWLYTGVESVQPQEVGVVKVFGKVTDVHQQGLVLTWPYPIGEIVKVRTDRRQLVIDEFWMHETPEDKLKPLHERKPGGLGLRAGWDGALLTGDRNLLHVRLVCYYTITDATRYLATVTDLEETVRSAVCSGALRAAGTRTADSIKLFGDLEQTGLEKFTEEVRRFAQEQVNAVTGGEEAVRIVDLSIDNATWPLAARDAYVLASRANQEREKARNEAIAQAQRELLGTAGRAYVRLVGRPWDPRQHDGRVEGVEVKANLIGRYNAAREAGDQERARELLEQINATLVGGTAGGEVRKTLLEAESFSTGLIETVKSRAAKFREILAGFAEAPELMLARHWADVRDEILATPTIEKVFVSLSENGKTVIRLSRDPEVQKAAEEARMKQQGKKRR